MRKFLLIFSIFSIGILVGCSDKADTNKPIQKESKEIKTETSNISDRKEYSNLSQKQFNELIETTRKEKLEEEHLEAEIKEINNAEPAESLSDVQEIVLIPQGKDQAFPDIKLIQSILNFAPIRDCIYYPDSYTPLMKAIEKEDFDKIAELIKDGEDINKILSGGGENCPDYKPLLIGLLTGNKELIFYLVEQGATPNSSTWEIIIEKDLQDVASLFLAKGFYPETKILRQTVVLNRYDLLKNILENDKNISNQQREDILEMAKSWLRNDIVELLDPNYQLLKKALDNKDIKNIKNIIASSNTELAAYTLLLSAKEGNLDTIKTLFSSDVNLQIECTDYQGNTPLMLAVIYNHLDVAQFLLKQGAQADITVSFIDFSETNLLDEEEHLAYGITSYTALMKALENKNQDLANLLIDYGAKDRLLVKVGMGIEGPYLTTISSGINGKCSRHRNANYWIYGGPGTTNPVTTESWKKE